MKMLSHILDTEIFFLCELIQCVVEDLLSVKMLSYILDTLATFLSFYE